MHYHTLGRDWLPLPVSMCGNSLPIHPATPYSSRRGDSLPPRAFAAASRVVAMATAAWPWWCCCCCVYYKLDLNSAPHHRMQAGRQMWLGQLTCFSLSAVKRRSWIGKRGYDGRWAVRSLCGGRLCYLLHIHHGFMPLCLSKQCSSYEKASWGLCRQVKFSRPQHNSEWEHVCKQLDGKLLLTRCLISVLKIQMLSTAAARVILFCSSKQSSHMYFISIIITYNVYRPAHQLIPTQPKALREDKEKLP